MVVVVEQLACSVEMHGVFSWRMCEIDEKNVHVFRITREIDH